MSYLSDNLKLLEKRNPALADFLARIRIPDYFQITKTSNGLPNVRFKAETGRSYLLHSNENPVTEAQNQLNGYYFKNQDATLLFGFGLGYLAKAIVARKEPHHLICIAERFPGLLKLALEQMDLTDLLTAENVYFFLEEAVEQLVNEFKPLQLKAISGEVHKLMAPAFVPLYNDYYADIEQKLHRHISCLRLSFKHFGYCFRLSIALLVVFLPDTGSRPSAGGYIPVFRSFAATELVL